MKVTVTGSSCSLYSRKLTVEQNFIGIAAEGISDGSLVDHDGWCSKLKQTECYGNV